MPKDLPGLLRWYEEQWSLETPERIHVHAVWRDQVTAYEAEQGVKPVGGSDTGAPAYSEPFRQRLENGPSQVDEDGYYARPMSAALARVGRHGRPMMARTLLSVAMTGFDWRAVADRGKWPHEMFEDYLREALIRVWREYRDRRVEAA